MNSRRWGRAVRALVSGTTAFAVGVLGLVAAEPAHAADTNYVSGVVVDERGPVAGIPVDVSVSYDSPPLGSVTTDANGRFSLSGLPDTTLGLYVRAPSRYLPDVVRVVRPVPTETFSERFVLETISSVTGRVINGSGSPVPNVGLTLYRDTPYTGSSYRARTDYSGRFLASRIESGTYYVEFDAVGPYGSQKYTDTDDEWTPIEVVGVTTLRDVVLLTMVTPTVAPTVTGSCKVGTSLTVDPGQWPAGTTVSAEWQNAYGYEDEEGTPIDGATGLSYLIPADALRRGKTIRLVLTATLPGFAEGRFVKECYIQKGDAPTLISPPTVSGNPRVGETVTASPATWSVEPTSRVYFWRADTQGLAPSSTSPSLVVPGIAAGKGTLYVWERPTFFGYRDPDSARSASLGAVTVGAAPRVTSQPRIIGDRRFERTMSIDPGTWSETGLTFDYEWMRDGVAVATGATYAPASGDIGRLISVRVTARKVGFESTTVVTAAVTVRPAAAPTSALPVVHGTPQVGRILTATYGAWSDSRTTMSFQWLRDGVAIPGETSAAHTVNSADVGHRLTFRVVGSVPFHDRGVSESAPTATVVKAAAPTATQAPAVSGTAAVGRTLSADPGRWNHAGLRFSYRWLRDGTAIEGATASTYNPIGADWTHRISVRVTVTSASYATTSATSAATTTVTKGPAPVNSTPPSISGRTAVGSTLTGYNGAWDNASVTYVYQWLRNGVPITGARAKTYALTAADLGKRITIRVTAEARGYLSASAESARTAAIQPRAAALVALP